MDKGMAETAAACALIIALQMKRRRRRRRNMCMDSRVDPSVQEASLIANTRTYARPRETAIINNYMYMLVSPNVTSQNFGAFDLSRH